MHEGFVFINVTVDHINLTTIVNDNRVEGHVVSLLEAESPLIYSWTKDEFPAFKKIISNADYLLWVTRGYILKAFAAGAEFAPSQGLLGVLPTWTCRPSLNLPALKMSSRYLMCG